MSDKPRHILEQFTENSHAIARLMDEDPEFLAICEDYDACVEALRHWAESKEPEAETRFNEYRTLIEELEEEIRAAVNPRRLD